jgi:negative regulator of replication initiation
MADVQEVVAALREIIVNTRGANDRESEPSANEYYAAILNVLAAANNFAVDQVEEFLVILKDIVSSVSLSLVRATADQYIKIILGIIKAYEEDSVVLRLCICFLASLISRQDKSFWQSMVSMQALNVYLALIDDKRTALRKGVHTELIRLLSLHRKPSETQPIHNYVSDFCAQVLQSCTRSQYRRALYVTGFLESAIGMFREQHITTMLNYILATRACQLPLLTAAAFRTVDACLQSPTNDMSGMQVDGLLQVLLKSGTDTLDMESNVYYYSSLGSSLVTLSRSEVLLFKKSLVPVFQVLCQGFEVEFVQIHTSVGASMKRILSVTDFTDSTFIISLLIRCFQQKYYPAWFYIIDVVRSVILKCRTAKLDLFTTESFLRPLIEKLAEIYQLNEDGALTLTSQVEIAIRDILVMSAELVGLNQFLNIVPFSKPSASSQSHMVSGIDSTREWVVTILRSSLRDNCRITTSCRDFTFEIVGPLQEWEAILRRPQGIGGGTMQQRESIRRSSVLLWSLFPQFCANAPSDISEGYSTLVPILVDALRNSSHTHADITPYVVQGLTNLAVLCNGQQPQYAFLKEITQPSTEVFLPAILSRVETASIHDKNFQTYVSAVGAWTALASSSFVTSICKKLFKLVLSSTGNVKTPEAADEISRWLITIHAMLPYLTDSLVLLLYKTMKPLLSITEQSSLQKRGYFILDTLITAKSAVILSVESPECMIRTMSETLLSCHVSSRHTRLKCIHSLLTVINESILGSCVQLVFGEVLLCLKDANKKCRDAATDVMKHIVKSCPPSLTLPLICSALVGETPLVRSCALIGMSILISENRVNPEVLNYAPDILSTALLLHSDEYMEQSRAVFSLMRVLVNVLPTDTLEGLAASIIEATLRPSIFKEKFVTRIRAIIRKLCGRYGIDTVRPYIPDSDMALIDALARQLRRKSYLQDNKSKSKATSGYDDMHDSDSDGDDSNGSDVEDTPRARPKAIRVTDTDEDFPHTLNDLIDTDVIKYNGDRGKAPSQVAEDARMQAAKENLVYFDNNGKLIVKDVKGDDGMEMRNDRDDEIGMEVTTTTTKKIQQKLIKKVRMPGDEYKAKKGTKGDVWKKGMLAPHAFIPLDARLMSSRRKNDALKTFGAVVNNKSSGKSKAVRVVNSRKGKILLGNRKQREAAKKGDKRL